MAPYSMQLVRRVEALVDPQLRFARLAVRKLLNRPEKVRGYQGDGRHRRVRDRATTAEGPPGPPGRERIGKGRPGALA
jgi:hypothetical protein